MDLTELQERIKDIAKRAVSDRTVGANQIGSAVGSPGQAMQKRLQEMFALVLPDYDFSRLLVMDVADLTVTGPDTGFNVGTLSPGCDRHLVSDCRCVDPPVPGGELPGERGEDPRLSCGLPGPA